MKVQKDNGFLGTKTKVFLLTAGLGSIAVGLAPHIRRIMNTNSITQEFQKIMPAITERGVAFVNCVNPSNLFKALSEDDLNTCYYREIFLTIGFLFTFLLFVDRLMKCCTNSTSKKNFHKANQSPSKPEDRVKVDELKKKFESNKT